MITTKKFINGKVNENCYIISNPNSDCIIIDPGCNSDQIINYIESQQLNAYAILNTHGHFDHIGAVVDLKKYFNILFWIHVEEINLVKSANLYMKIFNGDSRIQVPKIDMFFNKEKSQLKFGRICLQVIETPGHTKGSVCFIIDNYIFTGDTLFKGTVGRVDFPGGSKEQLNLSIKKIEILPSSLIICPGHGENSTIKNEINNNLKFLEALR